MPEKSYCSHLQKLLTHYTGLWSSFRGPASVLLVDRSSPLHLEQCLQHSDISSIFINKCQLTTRVLCWLTKLHTLPSWHYVYRCTTFHSSQAVTTRTWISQSLESSSQPFLWTAFRKSTRSVVLHLYKNGIELQRLDNPVVLGSTTTATTTKGVHVI